MGILPWVSSTLGEGSVRVAVDDDKPMITAAVQPSLVKAGETPQDEIP